MKVTALKTFQEDTPSTHKVRGTDAQDQLIGAPLRGSWQGRARLVAFAALILLILFVAVWLIRSWAASDHVISRERLRVAAVSRGAFVRDVAAPGTVVAADNPTLFAIAPGTVHYQVRAGDTVAKGALLASLDSPTLRSEYGREQATLLGLDASLARQEIEMRRQLLKSQQEANIANVVIQAAERELKRAQWAWGEKVISERDMRKAEDDVATAKLNYEHARATAALERDSLALDLRTSKSERDRQAMTVSNLQARVDELSVHSPVDGMVSNLAQPQRAKVPESVPLLSVVDLSEFEIEVQVSESYARDIKPGMLAEITLDGRKHPGIVAGISPEVRQNQVVGRVKFAAAQPPGLRQNQRAAVRIVLDERAAVLKFERSSLVDENTTVLYVARGDRAIRVPVKLGSASISDVEVLQGLQVGEQVIVSDMRDFGDAAEIVIAN